MARVVHATQAPRIDVAVDLGCRERRVPEQLLDRSQVGSSFEEVRRVGVPEPVRVAHHPAEHRGVERAAAHGEEERVGRAAGKRGPSLVEVPGDRMCGSLPERHDALLAALAVNVHRLLFEVHVAEPESDRLCAPQPARVGQLQDRLVADREGLGARDPGHDLLDVCEFRCVGQMPTAPWR